MTRPLIAAVAAVAALATSVQAMAQAAPGKPGAGPARPYVPPGGSSAGGGAAGPYAPPGRSTGAGPTDGGPATPPGRSPPAYPGGSFGFTLTSPPARRQPPSRFVAPAVTPVEAAEDRKPDEVVFLLRLDAPNPQAIAAQARVNILQTFRLQSLPLTMVTARLAPGDTPEAAMGRLNGLPGVEWAQPNHLFRAQGQAAPAQPPLGFRMAGLSAQALTQPASGVVAMIDTPAAFAHEAFRGALVEERLFTPTAAPGEHGTEVASLLIGRGDLPGSGRGARLVSLAAFEPQGGALPPQGQTRYLAQAFDAAVQLRPNVLNLSFGGPEDRLLAALLDEAEARGVCVVAAAGNGGPQGRPPFPASHRGVLGVTAVDDALRIYPLATPGPQVAVSAVGVDVIAATPGGYRQVSGTSFAAAFVSGALLRSNACATLRSPAAMRAAVAASAMDLGLRGRDDTFGAGLFRLPGVNSR